MFVERMEVFEYRQKFEVELSTDSANTETPRKLVLACIEKLLISFVLRARTGRGSSRGKRWDRLAN